MAFLLMDNVIEASKCSCELYGLQFLFTRCLLVNGRKNRIKHWDIKFLCAFLLVSKDITKFCAKEKSGFEAFTHGKRIRIRKNGGRMLNDEVVREFELVCDQYNGIEKQFLCSFRVQMFKVFNTCSRREAVEIVNSCYIYCYGNSLNKKVSDQIETGAIHPLTIMLKMMSDGHLRCKEDFNKLMKTKITNPMQQKIAHLLDLVKPSDFPGIPNLNGHGERSIGNYASGTYVRRGECLIINQLFKEDVKKRRYGTECDELSLKILWSKLGCESITIKRDLTRDEILECLRRFNEKLQISNPHYFVIVILSHGRRNKATGLEEVMDVNMDGLSVRNIKELFVNGAKCPSMVGKPKLFIIQACRGNRDQVLQKSRYGYLHTFIYIKDIFELLCYFLTKPPSIFYLILKHIDCVPTILANV